MAKSVSNVCGQQFLSLLSRFFSAVSRKIFSQAPNGTQIVVKWARLLILQKDFEIETENKQLAGSF